MRSCKGLPFLRRSSDDISIAVFNSSRLIQSVFIMLSSIRNGRYLALIAASSGDVDGVGDRPAIV